MQQIQSSCLILEKGNVIALLCHLQAEYTGGVLPDQLYESTSTFKDCNENFIKLQDVIKKSSTSPVYTLWSEAKLEVHDVLNAMEQTVAGCLNSFRCL